jgi:hypothetical protein
MENKIAQMELDMPQLRQMVLENTERINKNELVINKMRMEAAEQTRKISERDEWLENYRRENDRSMRESKERMDRLEKFAEASRIEYEKRSRELTEQIKETSEQIKETSEQIKETSEQIKGTSEQMKETDKQIKEMFAETNASIRRVSVEFLGVTGHIVEGLVSSSAEKVFEEAGFNLHNSGKNLKRELSPENRQMEIDVMLGNEKIVVPVEVKANFTKRKVKRWLQKMETFRDFFPEYADKEVIAAVAAINYEAGADTLAHDEGLLVIRVSSDDIFSLDPVDKGKLRKF